MIESSKAVKPWRDSVAWAAKAATVKRFAGPVKVDVTFYLQKPKSVKRKYPSVRPDLDKLVRSTLDGITMGGLWVDDAQVVGLTAWKFYTSFLNFQSGAEIVVQECAEWGRQEDQ
jgi:Holliday junction resolvase RusA-like endonuclease